MQGKTGQPKLKHTIVPGNLKLAFRLCEDPVMAFSVPTQALLGEVCEMPDSRSMESYLLPLDGSWEARLVWCTKTSTDRALCLVQAGHQPARP